MTATTSPTGAHANSAPSPKRRTAATATPSSTPSTTHGNAELKPDHDAHRDADASSSGTPSHSPTPAPALRMSRVRPRAGPLHKQAWRRAYRRWSDDAGRASGHPPAGRAGPCGTGAGQRCPSVGPVRRRFDRRRRGQESVRRYGQESVRAAQAAPPEARPAREPRRATSRQPGGQGTLTVASAEAAVTKAKLTLASAEAKLKAATSQPQSAARCRRCRSSRATRQHERPDRDHRQRCGRGPAERPRGGVPYARGPRAGRLVTPGGGRCRRHRDPPRAAARRVEFRVDDLPGAGRGAR